MMDKSKPGPVRSYRLPLEEVYRRYGRPGECKESPLIVADVKGMVQRREERRKAEKG